MDQDTKNFFGCAGIVLAAILIGIGLRAHNFGQFMAFTGILVWVVVCLLAGIYNLVQDSGGSKFLGVLLLAAGILSIGSIGTFLFTGDYARAMRVQQVWQWGKPLPGEVALVKESTATPKPSATPKVLPTNTPIPAAAAPKTTVAGVSTTLLGSADTSAYADALNQIWSLNQPEAASLANTLREKSGGMSGEQKAGADLFAIMAHLKAGETGAANDKIQALKKDFPDSPYLVTANFLVKLTEKANPSTKDLDKIYSELWSGNDPTSWFLTPQGWQWTNARRAAALELITLRSDQLSFRFFQFIHGYSTLPKEYTYLFILLVITIGAKLIALPLYIRASKISIQIRRIAPEISLVQMRHSDDPTAMNVELMELYKRHGINVYNGCLVSVIDLVFVIWVIIAVQGFAPQLYLDGAKLWWAKDVTVASLQIIGVWAVISTIQTIFSYTIQPVATNKSQIGCGIVLFTGVVAALGYFMHWPALVFILYSLLMVTGLLMNFILLPIAAATMPRSRY